MTIKATVKAGRLVIDEPTNPRAALHKALRDSDADVAAGRLVDAEEILWELRSR